MKDGYQPESETCSSQMRIRRYTAHQTHSIARELFGQKI